MANSHPKKYQNYYYPKFCLQQNIVALIQPKLKDPGNIHLILVPQNPPKMGNENSSSGGKDQQQQLNSPSSSSTGMPSSLSFLAKKRNSTKGPGLLLASSGSQIVVVNEGTSPAAGTDPAADPDLRRIKEIPHFLPLLRGVLPGCRDLPEVHLKVDPRPIYRFLGRLQHHCRQCAETVVAEQGRLFAHIVEIDQLALSLLKKTTQSSKKLDSLGAELKRADGLAEQLETTQVLFQELARSAESLNDLLPPEERLPPLSIAFSPLLNERRQRHFAGAKEEGQHARGELAVVDEQLLLTGRVSECRVVDSEE